MPGSAITDHRRETARRDYGQGAVAGNDRLHHGHDPAATGGKVAEPGE